MRTRERLASELRKVATVASPENAAKYEAFAKRAETGEFDDYADTYVCPITQLYTELTAAGLTKFAGRVANGEFDATKEESDEWARSQSGQDAAKHLSPEVRKVLGLDLLN
jgi:DNA-binding SARP family transcriptional activator